MWKQWSIFTNYYKNKDNPFAPGYTPAADDNPFGGGSISTSEEWVTLNGLELINPFDLDVYLKVFVQDAKDNGIDLSHIYDGEINLEFKVDTRVGETTIAYTDALGDDDTVHIVVNPNHWYKASPAKRLAIMYHELGHDILNFKHNSDEGPLMSVYAREDYTFEELFELKNEMFEDYKNGVVYEHTH